MEKIQIRIVQRVKAGESPKWIIKNIGFIRSWICNWRGRYCMDEWNPFKIFWPRGKPKKFTDTQKNWIYHIIHEKDLRQAKFSYSRWICSNISAQDVALVWSPVQNQLVACYNNLVSAIIIVPVVSESWSPHWVLIIESFLAVPVYFVSTFLEDKAVGLFFLKWGFIDKCISKYP